MKEYKIEQIVRWESVNAEYYRVEANSENEAMELFENGYAVHICSSKGEIVNSENLEYTIEEVE
jgi:hypothetical protein